MNQNNNPRNCVYGVILAGGSGSRLWPMSREMYPKQLLKLTGENSLFQSTVLRLQKMICAENIITVTNNLHLEEIRKQLGELTQNSKYGLIGEPVGRNTAPALGLAALKIKKCFSDGFCDPVIIATPSDQLIANEKEFLKAVESAAEIAKQGYIVTLGIQPTKPETGYGYIKIFTDKHHDKKFGGKGFKVNEFKEKPDLKTAIQYLESGNYFWNSGVFVFTASTLLKEIEEHSPDVYSALIKLDLDFDGVKKEDYEAIPSISIDYAIMEKSDKVALVPVDCGWSDLGSWEAIYEVMQKDSDNNYIKGSVITENSKNSYVYATSRTVCLCGAENLVVIETHDAVLVCDMSKTQDIKNIYAKLKKENNPIYFKH